jgi:circadian clock protein KaiC
VGHSGSGKTVLSLAFLSGAQRDEPALMLAGAETAAELVQAGAQCGLPLAAALEAGALRIHAQGSEDEALDEMGHKLLRLVDERGVSRLVVDGMAALADTVAFPERGYRFIGRLLRELKQRGVTSVFTLDPLAFAAATGSAGVNGDGLAAWFDNVFQLARSDQAPDRRRLTVDKLRAARAMRSTFDVKLDASGLKIV